MKFSFQQQTTGMVLAYRNGNCFKNLENLQDGLKLLLCQKYQFCYLKAISSVFKDGSIQTHQSVTIT